MTENHVHACTGLDMTCPCGYVFRVAPICVSFLVIDQDVTLICDGFSCETVQGAVAALRRAADTLEREHGR